MHASDGLATGFASARQTRSEIVPRFIAETGVSLVPQFYCGTDLGAKLSFAAAAIPKFNFGMRGKIQTLSEPRNALAP